MHDHETLDRIEQRADLALFVSRWGMPALLAVLPDFFLDGEPWSEAVRGDLLRACSTYATRKERGDARYSTTAERRRRGGSA